MEIFYKNYRGDDPVPLKPLSIPNCGKKCPLDKLYEVYKDIIPTKDFEVECHVPDEVKTAENTIKVTSGSSMNKSRWNFPIKKKQRLCSFFKSD